MNIIIKKLVALAFLCLCWKSYACDIDSIRIVSYANNPETTFNLSRHDFFESVRKQTHYVDTLILDQTEIRVFLTLTQNLQWVKDLNVDTDQYDWRTVTLNTNNGTVPLKIERNSLNNRMCILIYKKGHKEIMWVSVNLIDIHYKRYELNEKLITFFNQYTPLFQEE